MRLVFDIEADNLYWKASKIFCIVALDIDTGYVHKFTPENISAGIDLLVSADSLIGHNIIKYDIPVIEKLSGKKITASLTDTLVVSRLIYPDRTKNPLGGNSLKNWGKHLGNDKIDYTGGFDEYSQSMLDYCVQDVLLNWDVAKAQAADIERLGKVLIFEQQVAALGFNQELNGFGYKLHEGSILEDEMILERAGLLDGLREIFPDIVEERISEKTGKRLKDKIVAFNPQSSQQVYLRLVEKYPKIEKHIKFTDAGNPQMDSQALAFVTKKFDISEGKAIMEYRDNLKLHGQVKDWNQRAEESSDGRIHGEINTQGAGTGRCTHSNPNVAQVAKNSRMRGLWYPGMDGWNQVGVDLSGLELRMLAHYMHEYDDGAYANEILNGDIHTTNQKAAGLDSREDAKKFIYSFLYGAGDAKMASDLGHSIPKMRSLRAQFLKTLPALTKVIEAVKWDYNRDELVQLPDSRWVQCRSEHAALNTKLQGAGAIVSKYWMVVADRRLKEAGIRFKQMAYVHDEIQYAIHGQCSERACKIITDASLEAGERLGILMPIHSEANVGSSWQETH